jgi:hypothetical protein
MSRGTTWVNADGLVVGGGRRTAVNVTELDERAIDGELRLTPQQQVYLKSPGNLSGVTYDASNRAVAWTIDGISYTANYSSGLITVAGTDGTVVFVAVDPANRITGITS